MNRLSIFVDGNNMFYAQQKNGWFFDPKRVLEYFTKSETEPQVTLINAFWYTGLKDPQDQRGFRDALISLGYTVRTKILKEYYDDNSGRYSQKANLDIEIVVDMFNTVDQYDRVILFSGDGDFERAIELLRSKNTHITVVSTEGMIARELRNATDRYIDLNDIRERIEKVDY
ncbi:NYN domain-containing protein [Neosynechococcus sphagnicola]|nr:NYN domain-containing protein [Neosynechococcus sphagnicola]